MFSMTPVQINFLALILCPLLSSVLLLFFRNKKFWAQKINLLLHLPWFYCFFEVFKETRSYISSGVWHNFIDWNWLPALKSHFALGVDGANIALLFLNILLSLCLALYSLGKPKLNASYLSLFSLLNAASVGALLSSDALTFYLFWEFMLIPLFFLVGIWGSSNRVYAALKFFACTMLGSLFMLFALLGLLYFAKPETLLWTDLMALQQNPVWIFAGWGSLQGLLFLGFLLAFFVKIPVWPLHTWLPDAHTEAPTGGSVILAGVLLKLGIYGIVRWCLPLFPQASQAAGPVMMALGCVGIVLGSFGAWRQSDIKRLIAYSSVAHLGFVVLGIFSFNALGVNGALFQNIAHGLSTGALFLIFGMVYDRTHSRALADYGGLAKTNPWLAFSFVVAAMTSMGLPGLAGFAGEFLILNGTFLKDPLWALIALSGVLLGAVYLLKLIRGFVFGSPSALMEKNPVKLTWSESLSLVPILILMVVLGLYPQWVLSETEYFSKFVEYLFR